MAIVREEPKVLGVLYDERDRSSVGDILTQKYFPGLL